MTTRSQDTFMPDCREPSFTLVPICITMTLSIPSWLIFLRYIFSRNYVCPQKSQKFAPGEISHHTWGVTVNSLCKHTHPATMYTKYQQTCKRRSEVVEFQISSAESCCQQACFLLRQHGVWLLLYFESLHTKRKSSPLLLHFTIQCHYFVTHAYGAWPSSGRGVVEASHFGSAKIKTENFFCFWSVREPGNEA